MCKNLDVTGLQLGPLVYREAGRGEGGGGRRIGRVKKGMQMQNLLEGKGWLECNIRNDKTQEYVNYGLKLNALEFKADSFQY